MKRNNCIDKLCNDKRWPVFYEILLVCTQVEVQYIVPHSHSTQVSLTYDVSLQYNGVQSCTDNKYSSKVQIE